MTVGTYDLSAVDTPVAPARVVFSGVTMDIASSTATAATVCLSTADVPADRDPILYHLADPASPWQEIGRDTTTREDFVCGPTASFSPFAVGYAIPPAFAMDESIPPQFYTVGHSHRITQSAGSRQWCQPADIYPDTDPGRSVL